MLQTFKNSQEGVKSKEYIISVGRNYRGQPLAISKIATGASSKQKSAEFNYMSSFEKNSRYGNPSWKWKR